MKLATHKIRELVEAEYKNGFVTDIESDTIPRGLSEDLVRRISAKKNEPEFMLAWRLKACPPCRRWLTMAEPNWQHAKYPPIDYQDIIYYAAPKAKGDGPKSLDEVDPELLKMFDKLGISFRSRVGG